MTKANASGAAVELARTNEIDLGSIKGSGAGGQVTKPDVQKAIDAKGSGKPAGDDPAGTPDPAHEGQPQADLPAGTPPQGTPPAGDPGAAQASPGPEPTAEEKQQAAAKAELADVKKGTKAEITYVRTDLNGFWRCPFDDHTQPRHFVSCGRCGATRVNPDTAATVGEEVKAA